MNRKECGWVKDLRDNIVRVGDVVAFASKIKGYGNSGLRLAIGRVEAIWYDTEEKDIRWRVVIRDEDPKRKVAQTRSRLEVVKVEGLGAA